MLSRVFRVKGPPTIQVVALLTVFFGNSGALAQTETVIHTFTGTIDGGFPSGGLLANAKGDLFGTTPSGGFNNGVVFELSRVSGAWTEHVLHSFAAGDDGYGPNGLVLDDEGNLYGTTGGGGAANYGTAFKLSPTAGGGWKKETIYVFDGSSKGGTPQGGLIRDAAGNLYGGAGNGGRSGCGDFGGCGVVFELTPTSSGWKESVVHAFQGSDGYYPVGRLALDSAGNLYGATFYGGFGNGVVFELSPTSAGGWKETVIHSFKGGADGGSPSGNLYVDKAGNIYGSALGGGNRHTPVCGSPGCGVVFKFSRSPSGLFQETILHTFSGGLDGFFPIGELTLLNGKLVGATEAGGSGAGVIFELGPTAGGWKESVLYLFTGGDDGKIPSSGVMLDRNGNLYGETTIGGASGWGTVFQLSHDAF